MNDMNVVVGSRLAAKNLVSLDARRQLIDSDEAVDDIVVLFGLIVAGRVSHDRVIQRFAAGENAAGFGITDIVGSDLIAPDDWSELYRLWYRWKIPFGAAALTWWHFFCVALKQSDDVRAAFDLFQDWIEQIEVDDVQGRLAAYRRLTGIDTNNGIVAIHDEIAGLDCFVLAAWRETPLIGVRSAEELLLIARAGVPVLFSDLHRNCSSAMPGLFSGLPATAGRFTHLAALCLGRAPRLAGLGAEMRQAWNEMLPEELTLLLVHLEHRITSLEQVRFSYAGASIDNDGIAGVLKGCRSKGRGDWTRQELCVASVMWIWNEAGFVLQEINQGEISLAAIKVFLERRVADYEKVTSSRVPANLHLMDLARHLGGLRTRVERTHLRCLYFDGGNWERREFLVARTACVPVQQLPAGLRSFMEQRFGVAIPKGEPADAWKRYLGELLERSHTPSDLIIGLAEWAANADDLPIDYAIFTVPLGVKLDEPWEIAIDEIFCYTGIRAGFDPKQALIPLNPVGIRNTIGQRMRYNAVKKAQNYALVKRMKPQSFNLPDIAIAEDAHHGGHTATGIRLSARIPMTINCCGSEWKGIADVRLNRTQFSVDRRFREEELLVGTRYGAWSKAIADEAFARGLFFDRLYCENLDDGRNIAAKLGTDARANDAR
jgi:hypothetical protein